MATTRLAQLLAFHAEDPGDAFTLFALAREYQKVGNVPQARACYERLRTEQPAYVGTYYHLGKLYAALGETGHAVEAFQAGIRVADAQQDFHARAELQSALLEAQGLGFEED